MPRTKTTKAPQVSGNLALAQDMSNHVVDEATAEAVAVITKVFDKKKSSTVTKATAKTAADKAEMLVKAAEAESKLVVDDATAEAVAMTVNVFEKEPSADGVPDSKPIDEPVAKAESTEKTESAQDSQVEPPQELAQPSEPTSAQGESGESTARTQIEPVSSLISVSAPQPQDETITHIPLNDLHPPEFCPFVVIDNESMTRLTDSIKEYGVREPGLARPRKDENGNPIGGYELLIGGRRKRACELAELPLMPVIIRELDDDSAVIAMVDSNLEMRDRLLPSEKAWAYRIKIEALNHKGIKGDKLSAEVIAEQSGDSRNQIYRFIRLTELTVTLLDKVDASQLAFNPAVELSYLSHKEQAMLASEMEFTNTKPSLSQAKRLRKLKQEGNLTETSMRAILEESKPKTSHHEKISNRFRKYFPAEYTPRQMNDVIAGLLKNWQNEQAAQARGGQNG